MDFQMYTTPQDIAKIMEGNIKWRISNGLERTKNGRIFAAISSGAGWEDRLGNYVYLIRSDDDGNTFSDPIAIVYGGEEIRINDCGLWIDPNGTLWLNFISQPENATYYYLCDDPDADELSWRGPFRMGDGGKLNKPTILSNGDWIFPLSVWNNVGAANSESYEEYSNRSSLHISEDGGKTIRYLSHSNVPRRCCPEHMVLEKLDGSVELYSRTWYGIAKSVSYDKCRTWTDGVDSGFGGPNSRFHIRRLKSGNILLINNFYNPLDKRDWPKRCHLEAMISRDDGKTWEGFLTIDGRCPVSYPDCIEADNGFIYAFSDYDRYGAKEIILHKFTEEDVLKGRLVNPESFLCKVIQQG